MEEEFVEEACFYLSQLDFDNESIAKELNLKPEQVANAIKSYSRKIKTGKIEYDEDAKKFWSTSFKESAGDEKITLVDEKGRYYHGWKSELEKLSTKELVELLVLNKNYSDKHPLSEFTKSGAIIGYDPLVPLRNIRRSVKLIDEILQKRSSEED